MRFSPAIAALWLLAFTLPCIAQTPISEPLLSPSVPSPATPNGAWARQQIAIAPCAVAPKIDGRLDDACWKTATHAVGFYRFTGTAPIVDQTEAWICADRDHLYVAFHCLDTHPEQIRASETQRNGNINNDDYVTVDLDSQNSRRNLSTFQVNARGAQADHLEGGTADNITWAGDWKAATRRVKDGWVAEISISFALLRYPRGARSMSLLLSRKIARETSGTCWPYGPPGIDQNEGQYLNEFTGIAPPFYAPRPVFLPYILATAGEGSSLRTGLDVKYPLTTTLTGVGTLFPDFKTIEQDVTTINFSYTEKFVADRRPFFAEGSNFLPYLDLFYSRRIGAVDEGLKVVGKQGNTTLGILGTNARGASAQDALALAINQDIGLYSKLHLDLINDSQPGQPSNQVAKLEGSYGWQAQRRLYSLTANHTPSWEAGRARGAKDYFAFNSNPPLGKLGVNVFYEDISPDFTSNLGFNPELDHKGYELNLEQYNQFDKGRLEMYDIGLNASAYQRHSGGFLRNGFSPFFYFGERSGWGFSGGATISQRDQNHDRVGSANLSWGGKTLFQRGSIGDAFGRQASQPYNFFTLSQGFLIQRPFSLQFNYSHLSLGSFSSTQSIVTGTYRLSATRTIGGRLVQQDGATDIYLSFGQQARSGADIFILFGDPNSPRTRGIITTKVVYPF